MLASLPSYIFADTFDGKTQFIGALSSWNYVLPAIYKCLPSRVVFCARDLGFFGAKSLSKYITRSHTRVTINPRYLLVNVDM